MRQSSSLWCRKEFSLLATAGAPSVGSLSSNRGHIVPTCSGIFRRIRVNLFYSLDTRKSLLILRGLAFMAKRKKKKKWLVAHEIIAYSKIIIINIVIYLWLYILIIKPREDSWKKINPQLHIYNKRIILDMNAVFIKYADVSLTRELILMDEIFSTIGREIYELLKDLSVEKNMTEETWSRWLFAECAEFLAARESDGIQN